MLYIKNNIKKYGILIFSVLLLVSCEDFDEINTNPKAVGVDQVQVEYFINSSIVGAQQDPHISERVFILYWKAAGRQDRIGTLPMGRYSDGWTSDYFNKYIANWLKDINSAIQVADDKIEKGTAKSYTKNLKQVARIWRVYLMSELSDNFGPIPIKGFQGVNPEFNGVKDVYYFLLKELKESVEAIDASIAIPDDVKKGDPAYGFDLAKWKKYGNSMRMRLAMRLSEVDEQKAKEEFEDAAKGADYISNFDETLQVQEKDAWNAFAGVMTRQWNMQYMSPTLNNLMINLGGIKSVDQVSDKMKSYVKDADYMGLKFENHFPKKTNDPSAGYWFDGLHHSIDPRAYKSFIIPGDFDNPEYNRYPSWNLKLTNQVKRALLDDEAKDTIKLIDATYTWNTLSIGNWGEKGQKNKLSWPATQPRLANKFRNGTAKRIFFAPWETYFLLAEASIRGWNVPAGGKEAYEKGIESSFEYWGVSEYLSNYLSSQDYNLAGTSVSWEHTSEPPTSVAKKYVNGYDSTEGTMQFSYPENPIYKGNAKNDLLSKVITQKFIAQSPYLPLETWSDHRRLGLPFFENPAVEKPIENLPAINESNYMTNKVAFYPQRLKYPSNLENNVSEGYKQAVELLGGDDNLFTPLWWAQK